MNTKTRGLAYVTTFTMLIGLNLFLKATDEFGHVTCDSLPQ